MTETSNGADEYIESVSFVNSVMQSQAEIIANTIPNTQYADEALVFLKSSGTLLNVVGIGYAAYAAPEGQKIKAGVNESIDTLLAWKVGTSVTAATAFTGPWAIVFGVAAGGITALGLELADIDYVQNIATVMDATDPNNPFTGKIETSFSTQVGNTYKQVVNFETGETEIQKNGVSVIKATLSSGGDFESIAFTRGGIDVSLNFATGDFTLSAASGTYSGNLANQTIDPDAEALLNIMMDAYDAEFLQQDPNFVGVRNLFTGVADMGTGWVKASTVYGETYTNGDFSYNYTPDGLFKVNYGGLNAHYDSTTGTQTIIFTNPDNGEAYLLNIYADGTKTLSYTGAPGEHEVFTRYHDLPSEYRGALQRMITGVDQVMGEEMAQFYADNPELLDDGLHNFLAQAAGDDGLNIVPPIPGRKPPVPGQEELPAPGESYDIGDRPQRESLDGSYTIETIHLNAGYGVEDLLALVKSGAADARAGAFWDLYDKVRADGTFSIGSNGMPQAALGDINFQSAIGPLGEKIISLKDYSSDSQGVLVGIHTSFTPLQATIGDYPALQILEIMPDGSGPAAVALTNVNAELGKAIQSNAIKVNYPAEFVFSDVGGIVGGTLGSYLADGNMYKNFLYSTFLKTLGQHFGTFVDLLDAGAPIDFASFVSTEGINFTNLQSQPALLESFMGNLNAGLSVLTASFILDDIKEVIDVDGIVGDFIDIGIETVTTTLISETFDVIFQGFPAGFADGKFFEPGALSFDPYSMIARYGAGALAGEIITPESQEAAVLGSLGAAIGSRLLATKAVVATISEVLGISSAWAGPIGIAIGVFVGQIAGTLLGNMFSDQDEPGASATIYYNHQADAFVVGSVGAWDGGSGQSARDMAQMVADGVNSIIEMTGGALRFQASAPKLFIGYEGASFNVGTVGGSSKNFDRSGLAIEQAAFKLLKGFDLVGGHAILMRAWHNSDATNLREFKEDLEVAEAFQAYLLNPVGIIALMMDQPESALAQAWASILKRSAELELHLPSEHDLDGGWGELLRARGDIDPNLIPQIEGNDIVLTDPVTGEIIRLQHVIGPGYEIVRMEGTDGNDIIQVVVDGPSITYVDAGDGDDVIEGSDEDDIILGGAGDDQIDGNAGDDWINGGPGEDIIDGGDGLDLVVGDYDDDLLEGGADQDSIHGGYGNDTIDGKAGSDYLYGGPGDDIIRADWDSEVDLAYGEEGNDTLYGSGKDKLSGDEGDDTYILSGSKNVVFIERGNYGHDVIDAANSSNPNYLYFSRSISINELWFQKSGNDLQILVLGEPQSVTIKDWYLGVNDRPNIEIHALYYNLKLSYSNVNALVNAYAGLPAEPTGPYNYIDDAVLQQAQIYPQAFWQWAEGMGTWVAPAGNPNYNLNENYNFNDYSQPGVYHHLLGANGNDSIWSQAGDDKAFGGAGNDRIDSWDTTWAYNRFYGDSGNDTLYGGGYGDTLVGGLGDDVVYGQHGKDLIFGGYGNDTLNGGDHNDKIYGGAGNDLLIGGDNDDTMYGEDGDDELQGGSGNNIIYGGEGADFLASSTGTDLLDGGSGNDEISSGGGNDTLRGGDGDDYLADGDGDDWVDGGAGNDELLGSQGDDELSGGEGDDILTFVRSYEDSDAENAYDGGEGSDTLRIYLTAAEFSLFGMESDLIRYKNAIAEAQSAGALAGLVWTFALMGLISTLIENVEVYVDGALTSLAYDDVAGTSGNDVLSGSSGHDRMLGGEGDDSISGGAGDDDLQGGAGNDTIVAGNGLNVADGNEGDDVITGGADKDIIEGGAGDDTVYAGAGDDDVWGNDSKDILWGEDGKDRILGGFGDDTISGGAGNDDLLGEADNDILDGNAGEDTLDGGSGDDTLTGHEGNDILKGGRGDDILIGDLDENATYAGNDQLYGGEGNDTLRGYKGEDLLKGEAGADILYGGEHNDKLYGGDSNDALYGGSENDELYGEGGDDTVHGDQGTDLIYGGTGNDIIDGGSGNDTIHAEAGNDDIFGGDGDDWLSGGTGENTLTGGTGADRFAITASSFDGSADHILDFSTSDGDILFFDGVLDAVDFANNLITNYINLSETGSGTEVQIDRDGLDTQYNFVNVFFLEDVSEADAQSLVGDWGLGQWDSAVTYAATYNLSNAQTLLATGQNERFVLSGSNNTVDIQRGDGHDLVEASGGTTNYIRFYRDIGTNELWFNQKGNDLEILVLGEAQSVRIKDWFLSGTQRPVFEIHTFGGNIVANQAKIDQLVAAYAQMSAQPEGAYNIVDNVVFAGNDSSPLNNMYGNSNFIWRFGNLLLSNPATEKFVTPLGSNYQSTPPGFNFDADYSLSGTSADYDYIVGANGDDTLMSSAGHDVAYGGAGNDYIQSTASNGLNKFFGDSGNDTIYGGAADDTLVGGLGDDWFHAGDGNDVVWGGAGDDTLNGKNGNDLLYGGFGADIMNGEGGTDTVDYKSSASAVFINLKTGVHTGGDAEGDQISNVEIVQGSLHNDSLTGSDNVDTLKGGLGNDTLRGNAGNDSLYGEDGDDFLYIGSGTENLYGGSGADTFVVDANSFDASSDNIHDFSVSGGDKIKIEDILVGYTSSGQLEDYVFLSPTSDGDTRLFVDRDGTGSAYASVRLAYIKGVVFSDEQAWLNSGNLVIEV